MNVTAIKNGLVIDHIRAGTGWRIFRWLGLDGFPFTSALIMNVPSQKSGKKDLIKIDNIIDIDFSVLGFIDPDICVNIIKDEKVVRKINMTCFLNNKNPREGLRRNDQPVPRHSGR